MKTNSKIANINPEAPTDIERLATSADDPRIKSPDDILAKLAAKKAAAAPPAEPAKNSLPTDRSLELTKELADLRARYDQEIAQWREYERRIQDWRAQVVGIVQGLKKDAAARQELVEELSRCRALLKAREEELQRVRGAGRPNLKAAV